MLLRRKKRAVRDPAARGIALKGRPHRVPPVKKEEKDNKLYVTVHFSRPGWQRFLGASNTCERTFGLDSYGRRVYDSCDGKRTVKAIVKLFAAETNISIPESELAVTRFMKTLMMKGMVAMEMEMEK